MVGVLRQSLNSKMIIIKNKGLTVMNKLLIICSLALSLFHPYLWAQKYRTELEIPPVKVFTAMLKFAGRGQYEQIFKSISVIKPLLVNIKEHFDVDLETELKSVLQSEDRTKVLKVLTKMIFYDVRDILRAIGRGEGKSGKILLVWVKMSYIEYRHISGLVQNRDPSTHQKIDKLFNSLYQWGENIAKVEETSAADLKNAKKIVDALNTELCRIFSEF